MAKTKTKQVAVSALRAKLAGTIKFAAAGGTVEVVRYKSVVARIVPPPAK